MDSDRGGPYFANYVDGEREHREVCRAPDKAKHVPIAGTYAVAMPNEEAHVDLPFLDADGRRCSARHGRHLFLVTIVALHAMDVRSKYSLLLPVHSKILMRSRMPSVAAGWSFLDHPSASRWTKEANGRIRFGRISLRGAVSNYSFRNWAPFPAFLDDAMDLRAEFITA